MPAETEPASRLVVDSSFIVRFLVEDPDSNYAVLWRRWEDHDATIYAPALAKYEVTNALWKHERSRELSAEAVTDSVLRLNALPIELVDFGELHLHALQVARWFNQRRAYDSHFVALAQLLGCDLWTADKRLRNAVGHHLPWVRLVDE